MESKVHLHLHVRDLDASCAFYERFFGVPPVKVRPGYVKFLPPLGPVNLALSEEPTVRGGPVGHAGIQVGSGEAVARELERVRAAGLAVRVESDVACCHANQDKFWVRDPDGLEWEVYVLNYDLPEPAPTAGASCCTGIGSP
ncbi:MAG: VOC family protein [Planctomycetales bacterium]|nr:VOC family protein [Planctomycetales bacterium]